MKIQFVFLTLLFSLKSYSLVTGPSSTQSGMNQFSFGFQKEQGTIEPNENRSSFQEADISISKIKYTRSFEELLGVKSLKLHLELGQFESAQEKVNGVEYYQADSGSFGNFTFEKELVRDTEKQVVFYLTTNLFRDYNKSKFSNPRLDSYSLGLVSAFNLTNNLYQKILFHYGAGDGSAQNSYYAVDYGFGYRLDQLFKNPLTLKWSLFLEADTRQRFDERYDNDFSPVGTRDRIRTFKYGTVFGFEYALNKTMSVDLNALNRQGGYDARATRVVNVALNYFF